MSADHPSGGTLEQLAEEMGIEACFSDVLGRTVHASADTKRQILSAMGIRASNEAEIQGALDASRRSDWLRPLQPVQVVRAGTPVKVGVVTSARNDEVAWRLTLEVGTVLSERRKVADLALLSDYDLDGSRLERRCLVLSHNLPWGYHQLAIDDGDATMTIIVTPGRCWLPPAFDDGRGLWGVATQLYLLRSRRDWGIGDFGSLRELISAVASLGADVIGLNPLHALLHDRSDQPSPYSPASRLLLDFLNIDVTALPELSASAEAHAIVNSDEFRSALRSCRTAYLLDHAAVAALKETVLKSLFKTARGARDGERWRAFEQFRNEHADILEQHCLFLALRDHFSAENPDLTDWHRWPQEYQDPSSPAVARFADRNEERLEYLAWLQWLADAQLATASDAAQQAGMAVGLYRDLAVGANRAGAETWSNRAAVVSDVEVGAPPDPFNSAGQKWGLPPFHPHALRQEAYRSFLELLRANMRHAGALRIDHVMGLHHLYWVPAGEPASAGAYVRYPLDDLLGILALESHRQRCMVIGEDLGTVPEGFRDRLAECNILSYRVLMFERESTGEFRPPSAYPRLGLCVFGGHDLPTIKGWWTGKDIDLKRDIGVLGSAEEASRERDARERDKEQLIRALRLEGLLEGASDPDMTALMRAIHSFLARSSSFLAMAQLDDLLDEADPINVPGTLREYPNWRRRLAVPLEEFPERSRLGDVAAIFQGARSAGPVICDA
jgi:4-alpha-glucanotransferase